MVDHRFPKRTSPRLQGDDYAQPGTYFVTICTYKRIHWFGAVADGVVRLSGMGQIAHDCWLAIPDHIATVSLDSFVIMPNHLHGILALSEGGPALGTVVGTYKAAVTRAIRRTIPAPHEGIWHGRYYDHIIRDQSALARIRAYITENPRRWSCISRPQRSAHTTG